MPVLRYVITYQDVMTHIDAGDDNSAPERNMVRADKGWSRTLTGLLSLADFAAADAVRSFRVPVAVWTIPSPSTTSQLKLWLGRRFFACEIA
jgi:hypothetical protein